MEHNRSVSRIKKINANIDWSSVKSLLLKHYTVGKIVEGAASTLVPSASALVSH